MTRKSHRYFAQWQAQWITNNYVWGWCVFDRMWFNNNSGDELPIAIACSRSIAFAIRDALNETEDRKRKQQIELTAQASDIRKETIKPKRRIPNPTPI